MTLRHVVAWKVAGDTEEERESLKEEFRDRLVALPSQIDVIRRFEVGLNDAGGADNFDVVLVSEFDDEDALHAYITHPVHQEVVAFVRANTVGRAGVDYTL
ncbi:Dabb family protein [Humibacter ginsenosidimutans]|uniref:Dabb family protein n=1 Tax=Humibacter ginsenosidimutans TaxID=2599293 RepID=A0A5B8M8Z3_9MICO|nr:Dabb family protein [Humibacter ginsenosidimutans]QDZ16065.1 Dabb family protein [Humibacter ginsenosidimutans]